LCRIRIESVDRKYSHDYGSQTFITRSHSFGNLSAWENSSVFNEGSDEITSTGTLVGTKNGLTHKANIDAEISIPLNPEKEMDVWKSWRDVASKSRSRKKREQSFVQSIIRRVQFAGGRSIGLVPVANVSLTLKRTRTDGLCCATSS